MKNVDGIPLSAIEAKSVLAPDGLSLSDPRGKTALAGFFVGAVMRETEGRANPRLVQDLVARRLGGDS